MRTKPWTYTAGWLAACAAAACLAACGSSAAPDATIAQAGKDSAKHKRTVLIGDRSTDDMTTAVPVAKSSSLLQLKFAVASQPLPGQPLEVDFALITVDPSVTEVAAKFDGEEGLTLVNGAELAAVDKPGMGIPIRHSVTVVPKADGIYTLTATVTSSSGPDSRIAVYSVPVIAGAGLPELAAARNSTGSPGAIPVKTR